MNTNDDKKKATDETISRIPDEKLNDVQGGSSLFTFAVKRKKKIMEAQAKAKKSTIKITEHGASGSW